MIEVNVLGRNIPPPLYYRRILMLLDRPHRITRRCCPFLPETNIRSKLSINLYLSFPLTIDLPLLDQRDESLRLTFDIDLHASYCAL